MRKSKIHLNIKRFPIFILMFFLIWPSLFFKSTRAQEIQTIARAKQEGNTQTISGYVTALPHQLGKQYFYIQDETSGIQIYKYDGNFPTLSLGQKIKASGDVSEAYKEFRLKINTLEVLNQINIISSKEVNKLDEALEGELVLLKGLYSGSCSGGFYLENQGEKTRIKIQSYTRIKKPKMERDDLIQVIGITSQYNLDYRLLPRFQEDIKILEKARIEEEATQEPEEEEEEETPLVTIKEARQKEKDEKVLVEGLVTVLPGTFSARYFYIQDNTSGVQIYFSKEQWPNFSVGQRVRVLGSISESYNEKRVKISQANDISILGQEQEPEMITLKTGQINEDTEGMLVKVSGTVVQPSGNTIYLDDNSGKIKIYIKKEAQIQKPRLKQGEKLEITGIVSQYKDSYRILPRKTKDFKTTSSQTLISTKKNKTADVKEIPEEETKESVANDNPETPEKVLGASTTKSHFPPWIILPILAALGILGYIINDYQKHKRTRN